MAVFFPPNGKLLANSRAASSVAKVYAKPGFPILFAKLHNSIRMFMLRGEALTVPAVAGRLGATYLLEGSVRRAGEGVRVSAQLVSGMDGHTRWSECFDDRLDDLFDLQDRIAAQVAGQLSPNLRVAEIVRARR